MSRNKKSKSLANYSLVSYYNNVKKDLTHAFHKFLQTRGIQDIRNSMMTYNRLSSPLADIHYITTPKAETRTCIRLSGVWLYDMFTTNAPVVLQSIGFFGSELRELKCDLYVKLEAVDKDNYSVQNPIMLFKDTVKAKKSQPLRIRLPKAIQLESDMQYRLSYMFGYNGTCDVHRRHGIGCESVTLSEQVEGYSEQQKIVAFHFTKGFRHIAEVGFALPSQSSSS